MTWRYLDSLANANMETANYDSALVFAYKALNQAKVEFGVRDTNYVSSLETIGGVYLYKSIYDSTEIYWNQCLLLYKETLGEKHPSYAISLNNLALLYSEQGKYKEAEPLLLESLKVLKEIFGKKHIDYANVLNNLAISYENQGNYKEAEFLFLETLGLRKEILGGKHPDYATSLHNLAEIYKRQAKYKEADSLYLSAIKIQREISGKKHINYTSTLNNLGLSYDSQGKYKEAESLYLEAIKINKEIVGEKHPAYALNLNNLAILYKHQGKYKEAELLYLAAIKIHKEIVGEKHPDYFRTLDNLAVLYVEQGRYKEAEPLHLAAMRLRKEILGEKHPAYAISLHNLGGLYKSQGKYKEAEPLYLAAIKIEKEILGEKHPDYATSLHSLAILHQAQGKYKEAEESYLNAKEIRKEILGEKHIDYAASLNCLAELYQRQGKHKETESLYLAATKICKESLGEKHSKYASSLYNLASLYKNQGKYQQAASLFSTARQIFKNALGIKHIHYINTLFASARLGAITEQCLSADTIFTEALALQNEVLLENFAAMSERDRTSFLATMKENYEYYNYFAQHCGKDNPHIYGNVYNVLLQQKGILLYSTTKMRQLVAESQDSTVKQLYIKWLDEKSYGNKMAQLPKEKREAMGISLLEIEHTADSLEKALCYQLPSFKEAITVPRGDWKAIQAQLKSNEAAIEIVRFRTFNHIKATDTVYYAAYILTAERNEQPIYVFMPNGNKMEGAWFKDYQGRISNGNIDTSMYQHYFQVIAAQIPAHIQKIYFAADGVYHGLNLSAFLRPSPKKTFLISKYDIVNVGTTADILKFPAHTTKKEAFLVANPSTQAPVASLQPSVATRGNLLVSLPAAEKEAQYLDSLTRHLAWKNVFVTGIHAKEDTVKQMRAPKIALFATHGFVNGIDTTLDAYYNDYMRRSYLALTGYNTIKANKDSSLVFAEDGKLTPEEIGDMNLFDTELVILSACNSGKGQTSNGEGIYGLQRGFKIAGAENIIMTLDKVEDYYAMLFMKRFYHHYISLGKSVHKAFLATQRQCIAKKDIPIKTWAKFILVESKVRER